jgi:hypothetical protein
LAEPVRILASLAALAPEGIAALLQPSTDPTGTDVVTNQPEPEG